MSGQLRNPLTLQRTVLDLSQARTYEPLALGCEHLRVAELTPGADVSLLLSPGSELLRLEQGMRLENWPLGTVQVVNTAQAGYTVTLEHWSGLLAGPPRLERGDDRAWERVLDGVNYQWAGSDSTLKTVVAPSSNLRGVLIQTAEAWAWGSITVRVMFKQTAPVGFADVAAGTLMYAPGTSANGRMVNTSGLIIPAGFGLYHQSSNNTNTSYCAINYKLL